MFDFYDRDPVQSNEKEERSQVTKSGRIRTSENVSYRPRKNDVIKLLKAKPFEHYVDSDGRIYGFIDDVNNQVLINLIERGTISENSASRLMFVFIPQERKGAYNSKRHKGGQRGGLYPDEMLELPVVSETYALYNYANPSDGLIISIEFYPEHLTRNVKTALVVCNVLRADNML